MASPPIQLLATASGASSKQKGLDTSLRRNCGLTERVNLQFRAGAFNLFNHPNSANPVGILPDANFGRSTQLLGTNLGGLSSLYQIGGPRSFQLALKLLF